MQPNTQRKSRLQGGGWAHDKENRPSSGAVARSPWASTPQSTSTTNTRGGWGAPTAPAATGQAPSKKNATYTPTAASTNGMTVEILQPGLVLLRNAVDIETQKFLVQSTFKVGAGSDELGGGFYTMKNDMLRLNMGNRGRVIEHISEFPDRFRDICLHYLQIARNADATMPPMDPSTLLINFYNDKASFKWHKDSEDPTLISTNQGKPIVSFTVGLSCEFGYKMHYDDAEHQTVQLNSGDVIIFGGPSRMIVHSVLRIIPGTMPFALKHHMLNGRLNLTFRDVVGKLDTSQFPKYRVYYDIEENNNNNQPNATPSAQPSK